jgi:hypothetical protein
MTLYVKAIQGFQKCQNFAKFTSQQLQNTWFLRSSYIRHEMTEGGVSDPTDTNPWETAVSGEAGILGS